MNDGLFQKYEVIKLNNPSKKVDGIVLEFDDPNSVNAILVWAKDMENIGLIQLAEDIRNKIKSYHIHSTD